MIEPDTDLQNGTEDRKSGDRDSERERVFQRSAATFLPPPFLPPLTGEVDDSAISQLAERTTDSSVSENKTSS